MTKRYRLKKEKGENRKNEKLLTFEFEIETDSGIVEKFLSGVPYNQREVDSCVKKILSYQNIDSSECKLVENIDSDEEIIDNVKLENKKPFYVILDKSENCWVLFCVLKLKKQIFVLYKDPCGASVPYQLKNSFIKLFGEVVFIEQIKVDQEFDNQKSYGFLTLRNLKKLIEYLKSNDGNVDKFPDFIFCNSKDLFEEKYKKIIQFTSELSEN